MCGPLCGETVANTGRFLLNSRNDKKTIWRIFITGLYSAEDTVANDSDDNIKGLYFTPRFDFLILLQSSKLDYLLPRTPYLYSQLGPRERQIAEVSLLIFVTIFFAFFKRRDVQRLICILARGNECSI